MTRKSQDEHSIADQEPDPEITFHPSRQPQPVPSIFMPFTEGPKKDWTVNDELYHRFLKWQLKCENILECDLAALPECHQCKKVNAWSGNIGMDQYISWGLPTDQLTPDTIWGRFEEFCKHFRQGSCSVDEWYNTVQAKVNLAKYSPETSKILHKDIFWFFCEMRSLSQEPSVMEV